MVTSVLMTQRGRNTFSFTDNVKETQKTWIQTDSCWAAPRFVLRSHGAPSVNLSGTLSAESTAESIVWIFLPLLNQTEASDHLEAHQSKMLYLLASNIKVFTVNGLTHAEPLKHPRKEGLSNHWNICRSCFRCAKAFRWSVSHFDKPLFKFPFLSSQQKLTLTFFHLPAVDKLQTLVKLVKVLIV